MKNSAGKSQNAQHSDLPPQLRDLVVWPPPRPDEAHLAGQNGILAFFVCVVGIQAPFGFVRGIGLAVEGNFVAAAAMAIMCAAIVFGLVLMASRDTRTPAYW